MNPWLSVHRGEAPLIISIPHAGTDIATEMEERLLSPTIARSDADLHVEKLYGFARDIGATVISTAISRTVIDVNRDPSGASLYPGQITTGLCPITTFDGDPFYRADDEPDAAEIERRHDSWFAPYHAAISAEIARLRAAYPHIVLYDAHSIRSHVPRLFDGQLPLFNIGTNYGTSCAPELTRAVEMICAGSGESWITDGRFRGGWITRHYGAPEQGVHAIQMELAMRGYLDESAPFPAPWDENLARPVQATLARILTACIRFARDMQ